MYSFGKDITGYNEYVEVEVLGENDYKRTYYVSVVSREDLSETGDQPFIINISPNVVSSLSDKGTLNSYIVNSCSNFNLASYTDTGYTDGGGSKILGYRFNKNGCANNNVEYASYCIDAGRLGPTASGMPYMKSETIDMNSDFGKLITYMGREGWYDNNNTHIANVTTCVRIVGIHDNISVASDYNINDKTHAASYESYKKIADAIYDSNGKIKPNAVNSRTDINDSVKQVLLNYQGIEDSPVASFEREIEEIEYSDIDAAGNYTVTFKGYMYIPGEITAIENPTSNQLEILERTIEVSSTKTDPTRTVYDFNIKIKANVNTLKLPNTANKNGTIGNAPLVLDLTIPYCFKITIGDSAGMDAFMMTPEGTASSDGYQRMITVNTTDLSIYVYFPPSPSINTCGTVSALKWTDPAFNADLFRTTGCCNMPSVPENILENYCYNTCISTTLTNICDYRTPEMFTAHPNTADLYMVNEGQTKDEKYKIGSGGNAECIVKTNTVGWRNPGMALDTSVNKTDDAGNSLMVDAYRNNLYCRVSCSENWQLSMQSFGNFVGSKAIAAGSYFQINDQDLFISGKRTCYTTFINYGTTTGREAGAEGFTRDVNNESKKITDAYNHYSNLSHFYADLACENDAVYSTIGGHTVECSYSEVKAQARKFCYHWTNTAYCLTGANSKTQCSFEVPDKHEYYCDTDDSFATDINGNRITWTCVHNYTAYSNSYNTCSGSWDAAGYCFTTKHKAKKADGTCPDGYGIKKTKKANGTIVSSTVCYEYGTVTPHTDYWCDEGDPEPNSSHICTHEYHAHDYYYCEQSYYGEPGDAAYDDYHPTGDVRWNPGSALHFEMSMDGLYNQTEADWAQEHVSEIGVQLEAEPENHSTCHMCKYVYSPLHYNKCTEYGICVSYYVSTSNEVPAEGSAGINDGDKTPSGQPTNDGDYVFYKDIFVDQQGNEVSTPVGEIRQYYGIRSYSGTTGGYGLTTGSVKLSALKGYAYRNVNEARVELANDKGTTVGLNTTRYARSPNYTKFRITDNPEEFCSGGSWSIIAEEGISWASGDPIPVAKDAPAVKGGTNVILTGLDSKEECDPATMPNCATTNVGGTITGPSTTYGNEVPTRFNNLSKTFEREITYDLSQCETFLSVHGGTFSTDTGSTPGAEPDDSKEVSPCPVGDSCDSERAKEVRHAFLDGMGIKPKLDNYAQQMIAANANINTYARDLFDCQHFQMYNASDNQDSNRKNNQTWATTFMGHNRAFKEITSSFDPEISYSYDEKEYMTILGSNNVMERYNELNDEIYGCYKIANRSGTLGCYNNSTNTKVNTDIYYYKNAAGDREDKTVALARNYTINYYYDHNNVAWSQDTPEALSYGAEGNPGTVTKLVCPADEPDCNIGAYIGTPKGNGSGTSAYKRAILCTIGMVMDQPTYATFSDGKTSGGGYVYLNDKDYFWTAGTCYVNQIQYLKANYAKASIENSSFYKNKGYWYVNTANDTKANGLTLKDALENSNANISSTYNPEEEEELNRWSILGNYNVFPIKLTTPRDLYQYTYTFANIGSYGDGTIGRVMGRDQSLIVLNTRTCFYEVFEELCLCCGNPITAHVDSDSPYIFTARDDVEYEMSSQDPLDLTTSTLAITTSNISLSNPRSDTNRNLGDNWSDKEQFFFNGEMFTTSKGSELLEKIQIPGENIYSTEPEYKFTLNPEGLSKIREYNDTHVYGVTYEDLVSLGRYAINPFVDDTYLECYDINSASCNWEIDSTTDDEYFPQNRIINFTHYGSNFLMNEIKGVRGITFSGKYSDYTNLGMDDSCYVEKKYSKADLDNKARDCRWVDYVQQDDSSKRFFRLAYK